jgi:hypothetical protein
MPVKTRFFQMARHGIQSLEMHSITFYNTLIQTPTLSIQVGAVCFGGA